MMKEAMADVMAQEHSVMYPIDLLKVWRKNIHETDKEQWLIQVAVDTDASRQPNTGSDIQRSRQCDSNHLTSRRVRVVMERAFECRGRSRYVATQIQK